jgi:2-octaprenyl-6-methoxyphenol hydroxylase
MKLPEHSELIVVGGGPVGATLALLAARAGRQVTLLEARAHDAGRRDDPRGLHAPYERLVGLHLTGDSPEGA